MAFFLESIFDAKKKQLDSDSSWISCIDSVKINISMSIHISIGVLISISNNTNIQVHVPTNRSIHMNTRMKNKTNNVGIAMSTVITN